MSGRYSDEALRRLAVEGVAAEIRCFGSGHPDSRVIELDGVIAAVVPAAPDRSVFNSVSYESPVALEAALAELTAAYDDAGVRAWTVWVPDDDHVTAALLAEHGHVLDGNPRAMALELSELGPGPGAELVRVEADAATAAALNDVAYGLEGPAFAAALSEPKDSPIRWFFAADATEARTPICCLGLVAAGDDAVVTAVATAPEHRGLGVAGTLLRQALDEARSDGFATASLQASKLGAGVYERLGFRDLGAISMWERRRPAPEAEPLPGGASG